MKTANVRMIFKLITASKFGDMKNENKPDLEGVIWCQLLNQLLLIIIVHIIN